MKIVVFFRWCMLSCINVKYCNILYISDISIVYFLVDGVELN